MDASRVTPSRGRWREDDPELGPVNMRGRGPSRRLLPARWRTFARPGQRGVLAGLWCKLGGLLYAW